MKTYIEELRAAADVAVEKERNNIAHSLRMAFYAGIEFEAERRRRERKDEEAKGQDPTHS